MGAPSIEFLKSLASRTDDVLEELCQHVELGAFGEGDKLFKVFGAVNWGHPPCCVEACYILTYDGTDQLVESIRVVIEEASPDAIGFQIEVQKRLGLLGYTVEVVTEW